MSSDKHSLSESSGTFFVSSGWVLCSGRCGWYMLTWQPAHFCHCGPQGLAARGLYKIARVIISRLPPGGRSHVLVYGLFPRSSGLKTLPVHHNLLLLWVLGFSRASFPASRNSCWKQQLLGSHLQERCSEGLKAPSSCSCLLGRRADKAVDTLGYGCGQLNVSL